MEEVRLKDGGRLAYGVSGEGEPLLLVTGLGGLAAFWAPLVPALSRRFRVIVHDHRGTGASSLDRIDYSIAQMSSDVLELLDHLGLERAHFVGHSTGGAIGQTLAIDHPGRIGRLVLSATWAASDSFFRQLFAVRAEILRSMGPGGYMRASALLGHPPWWIRDHPELIGVSDEEAARRIRDPEIVLSRIAAIMRHDRAADIHRIGSPTLILGARDDMVTPAYFSEALSGLLPQAELVLLPEGGHMFPITRPASFLEQVEPFLGGD